MDALPDEEQCQMAAFVHNERTNCKGCGLPRHEADDPNRSFFIENDYVCPGCKGIADVEAALKKRFDPKGNHPERMHGRQVFITGSRVWSPDEIAAKQRDLLHSYHEQAGGGVDG